MAIKDRMNDHNLLNLAMPTVTHKAPQVSIGMPVYNGAKFIHEALDSLLAQTFTDFEMIISDNASTDETEAICREYAAKDQRIKYVRQAENLGAVANFQYVLDEATGEYFMWAAADDVWLPTFVMVCAGLLAKETNSGMAITGYKVVSRTCPLFNRSSSDVLSCIEIYNPFERVREYTRQPFSTHKDNLVYALWRREFIQSVLIRLRLVFSDAAPIGGVMNEYALFLSSGCYTSKVLFRKRYRYVPPGHPMEPLANQIARIVNNLKGNVRNRIVSGSGAADFLTDLECALQAAGAPSMFISDVLSLNRLHLRILPE